MKGLPLPELQLSYPASDARNVILEAGLACFAEHGFHGATMRGIAQQAGVSQALVHHHFRAKDDLWRLVGDRITADFLGFMGAAVDPMLSAEDGVRAMLRGYLDYWKQHPHSFRFNLWRVLEGPRDERLARLEQITRHGVAFMQKAQEAGFIRKDMPPGLALIIGGSLIQFWLHSATEVRDALAATGDEGMTDEAFLELVLAVIRAASPVPDRSV
jgi:TetR/AcrR family transcriptional regulator